MYKITTYCVLRYGCGGSPNGYRDKCEQRTGETPLMLTVLPNKVRALRNAQDVVKKLRTTCFRADHIVGYKSREVRNGNTSPAPSSEQWG